MHAKLGLLPYANATKLPRPPGTAPTPGGSLHQFPTSRRRI